MATVISLVSYPFLPAKVGGQKGVALFSKYFSRYLKLICVTTKKNDPAAAEGYEVLNILSNSPSRYFNFFYFFTLRKIIKEKKATHLMLEHPYYGWLGVLLKWFCGVKLIVHSHNIEGLRWKTLNKWWWHILWIYEKFTHRRADFNFFIHEDDRKYGIKHFGLKPSKCITMTYGIEWKTIPDSIERQQASDKLRNEYNIDKNKKILLFNGSFNHFPNLNALQNIIAYINPLLQKKNFAYQIIICGKDVPQSISAMEYPNLIFAGFVDDVTVYFKGSDIFLNPITEGGGIKTKLVEALGYNMNAVSTVSGATGVNPADCNQKLLICEDNDWQTFTNLIVDAGAIHSDLPIAYFEHFYWGYTTKRAAAFIE